MSDVRARVYPSAYPSWQHLSALSTIELQLTDLPTHRLTDFEESL
jgi:hypothetical protein